MALVNVKICICRVFKTPMIDNVTKAVIESTRSPLDGWNHMRRALRDLEVLNTMKRTTALLMALVMLLTGALATAESYGSQLELTKIRVSLLGSENKNVARLHGIGLVVTIGSAENVPTLQASLQYGDNQQLDAIAQIVDNQLVACLGGVNGTFYADLDALFGEGRGNIVSSAIGGALLMFGSKPKMMLQMVLPISKKGVFRKTIMIPADKYRAYIEPLVLALENTETLRQEDEQALRDVLPKGDDAVKVSIRYNPNSDTLRIRLTQDGKGIYIRGTMKLTSEPMEMVNISEDEVQYDLLNLDEAVVEEMKGELEYMGFKLDSFVENSNMRKLVGDGN